MAWYLSREYGDSVRVAYNDISKEGVRAGFPQVMEQLQKGGLALPAVFVDDEMVSLGYVDYFSIAKAIQKARGNGHAAA